MKQSKPGNQGRQEVIQERKKAKRGRKPRKEE